MLRPAIQKWSCQLFVKTIQCNTHHSHYSFAPSEAALEALVNSSCTFNKMSSAYLTSLVNAHVVNSTRVYTETLIKNKNGTLVTTGNNTLKYSTNNGVVTINGLANITKSNVFVHHGVVHVVNKVLFTSAPSCV